MFNLALSLTAAVGVVWGIVVFRIMAAIHRSVMRDYWRKRQRSEEILMRNGYLLLFGASIEPAPHPALFVVPAMAIWFFGIAMALSFFTELFL